MNIQILKCNPLKTVHRGLDISEGTIQGPKLYTDDAGTCSAVYAMQCLLEYVIHGPAKQVMRSISIYAKAICE